jgi:hypothetical protein
MRFVDGIYILNIQRLSFSLAVDYIFLPQLLQQSECSIVYSLPQTLSRVVIWSLGGFHLASLGSIQEMKILGILQRISDLWLVYEQRQIKIE